jgi:hypothetical protein
MPWQARLDVTGALHRFRVRGLNKKPIFEDDRDRENFLARLQLNLYEAVGSI